VAGVGDPGSGRPHRGRLSGDKSPHSKDDFERKATSSRRLEEWLNILFTPLSSSLMFLSELLESVSLTDPRQINFLLFASKMSTTRVPTLYVSTVVVASPNPPNPRQRRRKTRPTFAGPG
jgi:hypothetical protein